jgi:hypothetical protein
MRLAISRYSLQKDKLKGCQIRVWIRHQKIGEGEKMQKCMRELWEMVIEMFDRWLYKCIQQSKLNEL